MQKVIRDGKVAVLYSPKCGAGWSTWGAREIRDRLLFHPEIVAMVESGKRDQIDETFLKNLGITGFYCGGAKNLKIEWVPVGTVFLVCEHEGSEYIIYGDQNMIVA